MECVGHLLISFVCLVGFYSTKAEDRENGLVGTFPVHVFADENQLTAKKNLKKKIVDRLHITIVVILKNHTARCHPK